ncbi:hypothetical protein [Nocardiopsis ansamitocini]|uniref:Uncharacterized protein n=1 Tax=Nocardiopsis ansamitocini TaxID=1670832 RepID=A0A9W6UJK7_9ACTN|nr:hypothetical protein [Nocardiopsis ansamitocini]GLU48812.1 hypothetical protein Nans01_31630 [Nocardiopsis ansamitocini]
MGWNTAVLFVRDRSFEDVLTIVDAATAVAGAQVGEDEAISGSSFDEVYLGRDGRWTVLWDPNQIHVLEAVGQASPGIPPACAVPGTSVLAAVFSSVSGIYGFWLYDDAEAVRHTMFQDGAPIKDLGRPLDVEVGQPVPDWGPDEDYLWAVITSVTGIVNRAERRFTTYSVR